MNTRLERQRQGEGAEKRNLGDFRCFRRADVVMVTSGPELSHVHEPYNKSLTRNMSH